MYFTGDAQTKGRYATSRSTKTTGFSIGLEAGFPVGEKWGDIFFSYRRIVAV
jgi:hypothetical protein